ncbi:cytochrome ubiquinol oxidase subunit I, partial [Kitasatospora cineracea]
EWATSCPPPRHNFTTLPRIRSESPAFDLHHPEIAALDYLENHGESAKHFEGVTPAQYDRPSLGKGKKEGDAR